MVRFVDQTVTKRMLAGASFASTGRATAGLATNAALGIQHAHRALCDTPRANDGSDPLEFLADGSGMDSAVLLIEASKQDSAPSLAITIGAPTPPCPEHDRP